MVTNRRQFQGRWCGRPWVAVGLLLCGLLPVAASGASTAEKRLVHLYFADARRAFLVGEPRGLTDPGAPAAVGRQLVEMLIAGPTGGGLPTLPEGTVLRGFYLLDDGTAVVDFSAAVQENHPGSCRMEQLTLFSVVNSLVLNVDEIARVQVLIDGEAADTLAGHVAIDDPLTADMLLTR